MCVNIFSSSFQFSQNATIHPNYNGKFYFNVMSEFEGKLRKISLHNWISMFCDLVYQATSKNMCPLNEIYPLPVKYKKLNFVQLHCLNNHK